MSKSSYGYNRKGSRKKNKRIIKATERMLELVPTSEICIVEDNKKYFIHIYKSVQYNGEENPIQVKMGDDVLETLEILKHKVIEVFRLKESAVVEWIGLLSDQLVESEKNVDDEYGYGDSQRDKTHPILIQKYSVGVSLAEAILIEGNKPRFLQLQS